MANLETAFRMNIAYFIASPTWGGGEQYVFQLALHMKEQYGVQPFFLFPPRSSQEMIARFAAVGECKVFPWVGKGLRFLPYSGRRLAKVLAQWQIDILHINSRQSYFAAALAKRFSPRPFRLIATQHLVRPAKTLSLWRWTYRQIDTLICVSQCVKQAYLQPLGTSVGFKQVEVVYNSTPVEAGVTDCATPKTPHILFHGRICREKGIEPLFRALAQLADLPFIITFCGNISPQDKALWEQLMASSPVRDRIRYAGFQSDIHELLSESHIGVLPSIVPEAGPLSMLEDMTYGLAIVTSNNGSQPEIIQDGVNGLLCPPDDAQALAEALRRLMTDASLTRRLGQQAKSDFEAHYTYPLFMERMYHLYTRIPS